MNLLSGPSSPLDDGCGSWSDPIYPPRAERETGLEADTKYTWAPGYRPLATILVRRGAQLRAAMRCIDSAPQDGLCEDDRDALATARMLIEGVLAL